MMQYNYPKDRDLPILQALVKVWDPPIWAGPFASEPGQYGQQIGNCIEASRFARGVLDNLHVECEVAITRARHGWGFGAGWGDCDSYAVSETGFNGHAVVVGHNWLIDFAAPLLDAPGPVIATPTGPGKWEGDGITYTWAPGLIYQVSLEQKWGAKAPAARLAREVRKIAGPCRKIQPYSIS